MSENQVKISYKPLWKLLIDRNMTKTELRKRTQIAPSTFTKMNNDQQYRWIYWRGYVLN